MALVLGTIAETQISSVKTKDRIMYDQREKAQRDYQISRARQEEFEEGFKQGYAEGFKQGFEEGERFGALMGKIQILQQILGDTLTTYAELKSSEIGTLTSQLAALQRRLNDSHAWPKLTL